VIPHFLRTVFRMAHIRRHKKGFRAEVYSHGHRHSKVARTLAEARAWAQATEDALEKERTVSPGARKSFGELLMVYAEKVLPAMRGERFERLRIEALVRDHPTLASTMLCDLKPERLAQYRDDRLASVSPGSVLRELTILTSALEYGRRELRWITENPLRDVRKPRQPKHRERTLQWREIRAMLRAAGYTRQRCRTMTEAVARAMLFAMRTGMREGEICTLEWSDVRADYVRVRRQKGLVDEGRDVPLSRAARRLLESVRGWDQPKVFGLQKQTLDALFRKLRQRAKLGGFTFHDTRHTAATIISRKVDVLTLCKIFGWKDLKRALTYYNPTASEIAKRLR
jgi:integrase